MASTQKSMSNSAYYTKETTLTRIGQVNVHPIDQKNKDKQGKSTKQRGPRDFKLGEPCTNKLTAIRTDTPLSARENKRQKVFKQVKATERIQVYFSEARAIRSNIVGKAKHPKKSRAKAN